MLTDKVLGDSHKNFRLQVLQFHMELQTGENWQIVCVFSYICGYSYDFDNILTKLLAGLELCR